MKANARLCSSVNAPGEIESNFLMEELELGGSLVALVVNNGVKMILKTFVIFFLI